MSIRKILEDFKGKRTLLCIGPVSELVVRAAVMACKETDYPLVFICSRGQVDFRIGYLNGRMTPRDFTDLVADIGGRTFTGQRYICRDHGGPWQREEELNYDVCTAMEMAKRSFRADIKAAFDYIHIDPTKYPLPHTTDDICTWTVDLIEYCEQVRADLGFKQLEYEIGAENITGGVTSESTLREFLDKTIGALDKKRLPRPTCVVAQTGTLVKYNRNVGRFDIEAAAKLVNVASEYDLFFKEHNADFLSTEDLRLRPQLGIAAVNIAPEFGHLQMRAYLQMEEDRNVHYLRDALIGNEPNINRAFERLSQKIDNLGQRVTEYIADEIRRCIDSLSWEKE